MIIDDNFEVTDKISGLKLKVMLGKTVNRLHLECIGTPIVDNRDFWFTKNGEFTGTGSDVQE